MINKALYSSSTDDWATPQDLYNELDKEFKFNLDPCANHKNHKCDKYFTVAEDGLNQYWGGSGSSVFCNPPYGRQISAWIKKAYDESRLGAKVVLLIPARTDTCWFHDFIYHKAEIRFIKGRLKFGNSNNSAPFPSMIVIY